MPAKNAKRAPLFIEGRSSDRTEGGMDTSSDLDSLNEGPYNPASPEAWIKRLGLDHALLEALLCRYRAMQHHYPFVVVSEAWTVSGMLRQRPYLLLSVVANAASQTPDLQESLAKQIRDVFAQQIVKDNVTSLDVLQALLVHIAWSQYYLIPRSMQAYKYMQMAIGVLVDLRLDTDLPIMRNRRVDGFFRKLRKEDDFHTDGGGISTEAERTALGCFYLSGVISWSTNKPNPLQISDDVLERARKLIAFKELAFDCHIIPLLEYQRLLEDVSDTFQRGKGIDDPALLPIDALRLAGSLDIWWVTVPSRLQRTGLYMTRYYAARKRIYELGMLFHFRKKVFRSPELVVPFDLAKNLLTCVDAIKHYLDAFLAIDFNAFTSLPAEEWFRLIIACFILYKLSAGARDIPSWNVELCHQVIDLEAYLSAIAQRIRSTRPSLEILQCARDELYYVLPLILESARDTYKLTREAPLLVPPGHPVHIDLSRSRQGEAAAAAAAAAKCPATGFWVEKALKFDKAGDWSGVAPLDPADPAHVKAASDRMWSRMFELIGEYEP